jgi:hypothetical protein
MEQLKKKIGPLPMYVWIGLVVVAGVGYMLWKRSQTASTAAAGTSNSTGSSVVPASAGYAIAGDTGAQGWDGYNNNGAAGSTQGPTSTLAPTVGAQRGYGYAAPAGGFETDANGINYIALMTSNAIQAAKSAGQQLFTQPQPGIFAPYNGAVPSAASIASGTTTPLFTTSPYTGAAAPVAVPVAAGITATPGAVTAVNTPVGSGASSPASAMAPSALTGPVGVATAPAPGPSNPSQALSGPQALAAKQAGTPLWYQAPGGAMTPYAGTVAQIQNAIGAGWGKITSNYPMFA